MSCEDYKKAELYCKKEGYEIEGKLAFDPYIGWVDLTDKYEIGYIVLCDLNEFMGYCPSCDNWIQVTEDYGHCDESAFFTEEDVKDEQRKED